MQTGYDSGIPHFSTKSQMQIQKKKNGVSVKCRPIPCPVQTNEASPVHLVLIPLTVASSLLNMFSSTVDGQSFKCEIVNRIQI